MGQNQGSGSFRESLSVDQAQHLLPLKDFLGATWRQEGKLYSRITKEWTMLACCKLFNSNLLCALLENTVKFKNMVLVSSYTMVAKV